MKKIVFVGFLCISISSIGQVFNTASTLKPGSFSLGFDPAYYNDDLAFFFHGGMGILPGVDFALKYGIVEGDDYFGGDLEWKLTPAKPAVSLVTGGHVETHFGLDAGLSLSFPVKKGIDVFTGGDSDINFNDDIDLLLWIPIGVEIKLRKRMALIFEGEIPLTEPANPILDGGITLYF